MKLFCGLVLLAIFVAATSAGVVEVEKTKLTDLKETTNAEGAAKEKRGIFHTYSSPYVYHSPYVVHHAAPLIHHPAPLIHHSAPIIHHPYVATHAYQPIVSHHVYSHAPLVAVHPYGRR